MTDLVAILRVFSLAAELLQGNQDSLLCAQRHQSQTTGSCRQTDFALLDWRIQRHSEALT